MTADMEGEVVAVNKPLTPTQGRILECLASRPGEWVSIPEIVAEAYGFTETVGSDVSLVRAHIANLRQKLAGGAQIVCLRPHRYAFVPAGEEPPDNRVHRLGRELKRWTPEADAMLDELVAMRLTDREIGQRMGRTAAAIQVHRQLSGRRKVAHRGDRPERPIRPAFHCQRGCPKGPIHWHCCAEMALFMGQACICGRTVPEVVRYVPAAMGEDEIRRESA